MPVLGTILDYLGKTAEIDRLNQGTALTKIETDLGAQRLRANEQQLQMDEMYRQQVLKEDAAGAATAKQDDPKTASVRQDENSNLDPNQKIAKELEAQQRDYQNKAQLAIKYRQDPKPFLEQLRNVNTQLREVSKDMTLKKQKDGEQAANILRDVDNPVALRNAIEQIGSTFGAAQAKAMEAKLPHDDNGELVWNQAAKNAIQPYVSQYTTMAEKAKEAHDRIMAGLTADRNEEIQRHNQQTERERNAEIAIKRDNVNSLKEARKASVAMRGGNTMYKISKDASNEIEKVGKDYKIEDYRKGVEVAARAESQLLDPKTGYESITPAQARALSAQAKLMMDNYRSRTGGKYQEEEFKRMNGMLQRVEKYVDTIGEGDKLLAKDVMLQLTKEMKTMYLDRNEDLVRKELKVTENVNKKGGNAKWVEGNFNGDYKSLVESGRAKVVTVNGKNYLAFGKNKEDIYALPEEPEMPKIDIGTGEE